MSGTIGAVQAGSETATANASPPEVRKVEPESIADGLGTAAESEEPQR